MQLEQSSFSSDRLSRRRLRHWITAANGILLVASEADGALLGSCLVLTRRDSRSARLYSIASAALARGRGIATQLLQAAEQQARLCGCTHMHLEVAEDNQPAIALYCRQGYSPCGFLPAFYEDGRNARRFRKQLDPEGTNVS